MKKTLQPGRLLIISGIMTGLTLILAICMGAFAGSAFDDFEAQRSPELGRQAIKLARWAVKCRLRGQDTSKLPFKVHPLLARRAGVFVTLTINGNPRGCMGTIEPSQPSVAREIIVGALGAAFSDSRRKPLQPYELDRVAFHISIIGPLKPVSSISELAPDILGLLVRNGSQAGILLPGEAKTASWQIRECARKAGIPPGVHPRMFVFRTVVLEEKEKPGRYRQ